MIIQSLMWYYIGTLLKSYNQLCYQDSLTSLYNRRFFYKALEKELDSTERNPLSLLFIDIDNFKHLNDTFGHIKGDDIIVKIACILKNEVRAKDIVTRWGGDEFAIILPNTNLKMAYKVAKRLIVAIEREKMPCSISIGVASTGEYIDLNKLIAAADAALYCAKDKKNTICCKNL